MTIGGKLPTWTVVVPLRIQSAANLREHWRTRARRVRRERMSVAWHLATLASRPELPVRVTLTRIGPKRMDGDNLQGGFKAVRDEVARWLGVDDADPRVDWRYAQSTALRYECMVGLEEVSE